MLIIRILTNNQNNERMLVPSIIITKFRINIYKYLNPNTNLETQSRNKNLNNTKVLRKDLTLRASPTSLNSNRIATAKETYDTPNVQSVN